MFDRPVRSGLFSFAVPLIIAHGLSDKQGYEAVNNVVNKVTASKIIRVSLTQSEGLHSGLIAFQRTLSYNESNL